MSPPRRGPLERFTVIDLTEARSGPTAVRQFADWGARVIRIDKPRKDPAGAAVLGLRAGSDFQNLHRNKESLTLDLKRAEGRDVLFALVRRADVLIENMRPAVKFRLGIDYERCRAANPRLVYASLSGFGQSGPYRDRPGFDQVAQGMGGLMSVTGEPGRGPMRAGIAVADSASGLYCALGVMTALLERERSGEGQWVQTSLLEAQIAMLDFQAARWLFDGVVPPQVGNHHPTVPAMGVFGTADGAINIAAGGGRMWDRFSALLDDDELRTDPRFADDASRLRHRAALAESIERVTKTRSSAEWIERLNAAGIPSGPILCIDEVFDDPQVRHIGMAKELDYPDGRRRRVVAQPVSLGRTPSELRSPAPAAGADSERILGELGYDTTAIAALREKRVV